MQSAEFAARYGTAAQTGTVTTAYITSLYQNILGRAPDDAGFAFWLGAKVTPAQMLEIFSGSVENIARSEEPINTFLGRLADGTGQSGSLFTGSGLVKGVTIQLTDKADTPVGTADSDTILGSTGSLNTLQAADVVNGGGSTDFYKHVHDGAATTVNPNFTSVENLFFENIGTGALTANLINATGVQQVWMDRANGQGLTVLGGAEQFTVGIVGGKAAANGTPDLGNDYTVQFKDSFASGAADTLAIALDGAKVDQLSIGGTNAANQFETLNINAVAGASTITTVESQGANYDQLKVINIEGAGSVKITDATLSTALTTVDASKNTGGVIINGVTSTKDLAMTGGSGKDSFTIDLAVATKNIVNTGAGDDTVTLVGTVVAADLTVNDQIKGGDGVDTLALSSQSATNIAAAATRTQISEFETIQITDSLTTAVDVSKFGTIATVQLNAGANTGTLSGLTSAAVIEYRADADSVGVTTLTIPNATNVGQVDTASIKFNADLTGASGIRQFQVGLQGIENLVVSTADRDAALTASNGATEGYKIVTTNAGSLTNVTVTGDRAFQFTADAGSNLLTRVDANTLTGKATIDASAANPTTTGVTILTGTGNDVITGTNKGDSLVGGAGNDTIDGGAGETTLLGGDILTGGTGSDTFLLRTSGNNTVNLSTTAGVDTITDFTFGVGNDVLSIANIANIAQSGTASAALVGALNAALPSGGGAGAAELIILDSSVAALRAANASALNGISFALAGSGAYGNVLIAYSATDGGDVRLAQATIVGGDINNVIDVAVLTGITTATLNASFNAANITGFGQAGVTFTANAAPFSTATAASSVEGVVTAGGDDIINATSAQAVNGATLINGQGGQNTLNITDALGADLNGAGISNIAVINLQGGSGANRTIGNFANVAVNNTSAAAATITLGNVVQSYVGNGQVDTVTLGAVGQSVTAGAGADIINTSGAFFGTGTVINGGADGDTLNVTANGTLTAATTITSVETLAMANNIVLTTTVAQYAAFGTVNGGTATSAVTFSDNATASHATGSLQTFNLAAGGQTFTATAANAYNITGGTGNDTINLSAVTAADTVNGGTGVDTLALTGDIVGGAAVNVNQLSNIEVINVQTAQTAGNLLTLTLTTDVTATTGQGSLAVNLTGANNAQLAVAYGGTSTVGATVTGSTGADTITGGGQADTIVGGDGNDTIQVSNGADRVTVGNGNDIIVLTTAANTVATGITTITDFVSGAAASNDRIDMDLGVAAITARGALTAIVSNDGLAIMTAAFTTAEITGSVAAAAAANNAIVVFNSSTSRGEIWFDADWTNTTGRVQVATLDNFTSLVQVTGLSATIGTDFTIT